MNELEKVIQTLGTYKKTIFRNAYSGYTVFQIIAADETLLKSQDKRLNGKLICAGVIPEYRIGTPLFLEGTVSKSKYGYQLNVTTSSEKSWNIHGLSAYLTNICPGIGITTANALAEIFQNKLFDIVKKENGPTLLSEKVWSLSYDSAVQLCETIGSTQTQKEVYDEIVRHGGSWSNAVKAVQRHGVNTLKELRENPYKTGSECGLDFYACDQVAKKSGKNATDQERLKQALIKAFDSERGKGHVFSTESDVCKQAKSTIKKSAFNKENVPSAMFLDALADQSTFVFDIDNEGNEAVYLKWMLNAEMDVASQISRLMDSAVELNYDASIVEWAESNCGIQYAPQQRESFKLIQKSGIAIVTGGPGTGKTTTVNGLISAYEKLNPNKIIRMCAPTGRAAQRMTESTGRESVTIHRLLEYKPFGNDISHKNASDPIIADLIVVDEASMLDIELASIFLSAVQPGALVLFIGDVNQLPSVGPGDVLNDMIRSGCVPTVQLTTVYRQGSQSPIIVNANRINEGNPYMEEADDYHTVTLGDAQSILMRIVQLSASMYDPEHPFDVQVLAPTHKGDAGVAAINNTLQQVLNPPRGQVEIRYGSRTYRVGDKVILLNNNYASGYFNGDIGIVKDIMEDGVELDILGKPLHLSRSEMDDMNLAYCISIHKSQGSEFANVIVSLPLRPGNMLKRNLLYTAVTRAKKTVNVIGEGESSRIAINTCDTGKRNTRLVSRIQSCMRKGDIDGT